MTIYVRHETDDWVKKTITQNGAAYTGAWSYQIALYNGSGTSATGSWTSAVVVGTDKGIDIQGLTRGDYLIFYRIDGQGVYVPVIDPEFLIVS